MKTKTNCKSGKLAANHSETLIRDNSKSLRVRSALRSGKRAN